MCLWLLCIRDVESGSKVSFMMLSCLLCRWQAHTPHLTSDLACPAGNS